MYNVATGCEREKLILSVECIHVCEILTLLC